MSPEKSPRTFIALLFVVLGFAIGYIAPHGQAARVQAPDPMGTVDSVPGGFHATGKVMIGNPVGATYMMKTTNWSPCAMNKTCHLEFTFDNNATSQATCPNTSDSCLPFYGQMNVDVGGTVETKMVAGTMIMQP